MTLSRGRLLTVLVMVCAGFTCLSAQETVQVTVSIAPQRYFVEQIGGEQVTVEVMVPPGASPHVYEPKPKQMVALNRSKVYYAVGVAFENVWLPRFLSANPEMVIVRTDEGIEKMSMPRYVLEGTGHADEEVHEHSHDDPSLHDPHIWLSPPLVLLQVRHIRDALIQADPEHQDIYNENFSRFAQELIELDTELTARFSRISGKKEFIIFHPAWGYFSHAYGLTQIPIEIEGKEPKPADLVLLIEYAREHGIKAVFVQPQISPQTAEMIAREIGGKVAVADPLSPDWYTNLVNVADIIINAITGK